jgi:hypothetical protein
MITKFRNISWLTLCEVGYNFVLGQELFVAGLDTPFKPGSNVLMVCMNRYGQIGVVAKDNIDFIDKIKLKINVMFFTHEAVIICLKIAKKQDEYVKSIQEILSRSVFKKKDAPQNTMEQNGHIAQQTKAADGPTAHA